MLVATNTSKFRIGVGDKLLAPGKSTEVDDALAERIEQLGDGLLRLEEPKPKKLKKGKGGGAEATDMSSWTPARVGNWAAKQSDPEVIRAALDGDLRDGAREALELRLLELEEPEGEG